MLVIGGAAGGTYALLYANENVTNTFTSGQINIALTETDSDNDGDADNNTYPLEAGTTIQKDPCVTVTAGSEPHWLMVQLIKSENFDDFMTYEVDPLWTAIPGYEGVYYTVINQRADADLSLPILLGNEVHVRADVTNTMLRNLTPATYPTLTVKAYAVQLDGVSSVLTAWNMATGQ